MDAKASTSRDAVRDLKIRDIRAVPHSFRVPEGRVVRHGIDPHPPVAAALAPARAQAMAKMRLMLIPWTMAACWSHLRHRTREPPVGEWGGRKV